MYEIETNQKEKYGFGLESCHLYMTCVPTQLDSSTGGKHWKTRDPCPPVSKACKLIPIPV